MGQKRGKELAGKDARDDRERALVDRLGLDDRERGPQELLEDGRELGSLGRLRGSVPERLRDLGDSRGQAEKSALVGDVDGAAVAVVDEHGSLLTGGE
jgi:hypothetical protein